MQQRREEVTKRELYRERKKEKNENKKQRARERTFPFNSFKFVATNRDLICTCVRVCMVYTCGLGDSFLGRDGRTSVNPRN